MLVGEGDVRPFDHVFHALTWQHIYSFTDITPNERDVYFAAACAKVVGLYHRWLGITHVQVHGSTNALFFALWSTHGAGARQGRPRPAFVYTIHDYSFEVAYSIDLSVIHNFVCGGTRSQASTEAMFEELGGLFTHPDRRSLEVFPAAIGIHQADVVTCVSHRLAQNIVDGTLNFTMREVVWDCLIEKAKASRFFGIPNGVELSPFADPALSLFGLQLEEPIATSIQQRRREAREILFHFGLLTEEQRDTELALFVGRFQVPKGFDLCVPASKYLASLGVTLVVMGQPAGEHEISARLRKAGVAMLDDPALQSVVGTIVRLASSFVFVPSRSEAFGLVAAEGLMFGSQVISTGVGGMRDFLFEHPSEITLASPDDDLSLWPERNAYLFDPRSEISLESAIGRCVGEYLKLDPAAKDRMAEAMMRSVRRLRWDCPDGPALLYSTVYGLASKARDSRRLQSDVTS